MNLHLSAGADSGHGTWLSMKSPLIVTTVMSSQLSLDTPLLCGEREREIKREGGRKKRERVRERVCEREIV